MFSRARRKVQRFFRLLDDERIDTFQVMYYVLIVVAGSYLMFVARTAPVGIEDQDLLMPILGHPFYEGWCALNIICPMMTLIGRHIGVKAAGLAEGQANSGVGAAWLRLAGDTGVWGAILIYIVCVFNTAWWGQGLYGAFFVMMGVPGGFMFSLRSMRRLMQMREYAHHLKLIEDIQ